ncbi:hypothetical protein ABGB17_29215 [Sphaerisporangium sp. B11E5]|uniref:caspase, EACC1-associated type n=1 Tax=Sphaerisporangium sp. B11E5 TaxID=3153563 RepID=UPI00325E5F33
MTPDVSDGLLLARPGARVLLVGSGRYRDGSRLPEVAAVPRTVADLSRCLVDRTGLDPSHLTVLEDPADPQEFGAALVEAATQATDVLVLYYVGHGLLSPRGELHLATHATRDLTTGIPSHQALPYKTVDEVLATCRAATVLVVLDCCFSGRAQAAWRAGLEEVFATVRPGCHVLAAAGPSEAAWAPEGQPHTAMSGALIHLLTGGDPTAGPRLTIDDLHRAVSRDLTDRGLPAPHRKVSESGVRRPFAVNIATGDAEGDDTGQVSPYRGLAAFGPQDAEFFFGRTRLTQTLVDRVAEQLSHAGPLMVVGPSGAGKSSLLRAGLMAALERTPATHVLLFTPGRDPVDALTTRLTALGDPLPACLEDPPGAAPWTPAGPGQRVVIADQFEEVFTLCQDEGRRRLFVAALQEMCANAVVVLALRADFFGRCMSHPELAAALDHPLLVTPMTTAQLREAIEGPARLAGLTLQPGLVDLLMEEIRADMAAAGHGGEILPLLSHALLATWRRREGTTLTTAGYLATGGVTQALARSAETTLESLDLLGRRAARQMLPRLVQLGEGADDTRVRLPRTELLSSANHPPDASSNSEQALAWQVLDRFVAARLITVDADTIQLSHEALIRAWPRLRDWIAADRATLLTRQRLDQQARDWATHDHDPSYLYTGTLLATAEQAYTRWKSDPAKFPPLSELSERFLRAGTEAKDRARHTRRLGVAAVATSLTLVMITAIAIAINAVGTARTAEQQRLAQLSQQVAARSDDLVGIDPVLSRQLAVAAFNLSRTPEARFSLVNTWANPNLLTLSGHGAPVLAVAVGQVEGRSVIVSGSGDATVRVWDAGTGKPVRTLSGHDGGVFAVAVGQVEGRPVMVSGSGDATVRVWDAETGKPVRTLRGHGAGVSAVAVGQVEGRPVIVSGSYDTTVRVWDAGTGKPVRTLSGHVDSVLAVAVGQVEGRSVIVSGSGDATVRVWDAGTGKPVRTLSGHDGGVFAVAVGQVEGRPVMVSGSDDATVRVWDAGTGKPVRTLSGHVDSVLAVAVGQVEGRPVVISGSGDGTVRVWDAGGGKPVRTLSGHGGGVSAVAVGQVGDRPVIVAGSDDKKVRVWDALTGKSVRTLSGHGDVVSAVAVGQVGGRPVIVSGSDDSTVRVWDALTGKSVRTLSGHGDVVSAVAVGQVGGRPVIVSGSDDRTVRVWDLTPPSDLELLRGVCARVSVPFTQEQWEQYVGIGESIQPVCP